MDEFEWDEDKAELNLAKHGVDFIEAASTWFDHFNLEILDLDNSTSEERWIRVGFSKAARLLVVVYVSNVKSGKNRIISARKATRLERDKYSKGKI